jgi:hypothetical protein
MAGEPFDSIMMKIAVALGEKNLSLGEKLDKVEQR